LEWVQVQISIDDGDSEDADDDNDDDDTNKSPSQNSDNEEELSSKNLVTSYQLRETAIFNEIFIVKYIWFANNYIRLRNALVSSPATHAVKGRLAQLV
jgi:hypothetical protein